MKFITSLFAMFVCGIALAQGATVEPVTVPAPAPVVAEPAPAAAVPAIEEKKFSISFDASTTLFDFQDGSITEVDALLTFDVSKNVKFGVGLPFYNDSNDYFDPYDLAWQLNKGISTHSGTGLGDIDLFTTVNLIDGKCAYLKNDHVWFDVTGGIKVPVDGTYSSGNYVPHVGAELGGEWGPVSLSYGFSYEFVDEYTFSSPLGGFVNSDIYEGVATIGYSMTDAFEMHLKGTQYHWNGKDLFLIGPGFEYEISKNISFGGDLYVPANGDTENGELDLCLSAGIGFKF